MNQPKPKRVETYPKFWKLSCAGQAAMMHLEREDERRWKAQLPRMSNAEMTAMVVRFFGQHVEDECRAVGGKKSI